MVYRGRIKNGAVVLDEKVSLPDGTEVRVEPISPVRRMTLAEQFKDIIGIANDLPEDMSRNHDHYIHGMPKR